MDNKNMIAAAHCEMGPSTLPARSVCPCHESAPGGSDADSGTRSHKVVETLVKMCRVHGADKIDLLETPENRGAKPSENYLPGTTDDEIARGTWGAKTIMGLRDKTAPGEFIYTEFRTSYEWNPDDPAQVRLALEGKFGTVDAWWKDPLTSTVYIADYKTYATADGEFDYSPQGKMYAALLEQHAFNYRNAVFFVVAAGNRAVAKYEFTMAHAKLESAGIVSRVEAVRFLFRGDDARAKCAKPSAWCKHCLHATTCPAVTTAAMTVSSGSIMAKPLAVRMALVPVLESFCKGVKAEVKKRLEEGDRVWDEKSGVEYAFAERRGKSKLKDLKGLAECVVTYGVSPAVFASAVTISKSAVDSLLKSVDEEKGRKIKKADREAVYLPYFTEAPIERYVKRIN